MVPPPHSDSDGRIDDLIPIWIEAGINGLWPFEVQAGMDVVDKIAAVETGNRGGHQDVPVDAVTITEVTIDD